MTVILHLLPTLPNVLYLYIRMHRLYEQHELPHLLPVTLVDLSQISVVSLLAHLTPALQISGDSADKPSLSRLRVKDAPTHANRDDCSTRGDTPQYWHAPTTSSDERPSTAASASAKHPSSERADSTSSDTAKWGDTNSSDPHTASTAIGTAPSATAAAMVRTDINTPHTRGTEPATTTPSAAQCSPSAMGDYAAYTVATPMGKYQRSSRWPCGTAPDTFRVDSYPPKCAWRLHPDPANTAAARGMATSHGPAEPTAALHASKPAAYTASSTTTGAATTRLPAERSQPHTSCGKHSDPHPATAHHVGPGLTAADDASTATTNPHMASLPAPANRIRPTCIEIPAGVRPRHGPLAPRTHTTTKPTRPNCCTGL